MKRFCLSVFAVASMLFAASCQQELNPVTDGDTTVTFTVSAGDVATRAIADGTNVNILHWEIYGTDINTAAQPLGEGRVEDADGNKEFTVELKLLADQEYNIVFWAEVKDAGHYDTSDLRSVKIVSYSDENANDETRAAFFAVHNFETENGAAINETVYLYRPFAQINLGSTTYETSFNLSEPLKVESTSMTVNKIANVFNTLSGEGVADNFDGKVTFQAAATPNGDVDATEKKLKVNGETYYWLGMNYLIVNGNSDNVTVDVTLKTNHGDVNHTVSNVPVKENYRTNLLGNFLTTGATFNVVVDERFQTPDEVVVVGSTVVRTSEELATALKEDKEHINIFLDEVGNVVTRAGEKKEFEIAIGAWTEKYYFGGASTKTITINANGNKINFVHENGDWNYIRCVNDAAKWIINDATLTNSGKNNGPWNRHDIRFYNAVELNNVTSDKAIALLNDGKLNDVQISDVHPENSEAYGLWITAEGQTVLLDGVTITPSEGKTTDRAIKIADQYLDSPAKVTLSVENSTFVSQKKAAVLVTSKAGAVINWGRGNDITGVAEDSNFAVWVDEDRAEYADKVVVKGGLCKVEGDDTANTFDSAIDAREALAEDGATVYLYPAEDGSSLELEGKLSLGEGSSFIGVGDEPVGVNNSWSSNTFSNQAHFTDTHIENIFFDNNLVIDAGIANGNVTFKNCVFGGDRAHQGVHFDSGEGTIVFDNCTFVGRNMFGSSLEKVIFNNCTFLNKKSSLTGADKWTGVNMWGKYEFNNCEFDTEAHCNVKCDGVVAAFNGCKFTDGRDITSIVNNGGKYAADITFDGKTYVTDGLLKDEGGNYIASTEAGVTEAIKAGATEVTLTAGDYVVPAAAQGKTITFKGTDNPEDVDVAVTKVGTGGENCDYGLDGSNVTFENITITTNSSTYIGYARCNGTYKNCIINGTYTLYGASVFEDCTFNVSGDVYNIWTWGAPTATFIRCTFNSDGKALLLYGTENTKLTVNNCTFNDKGGLSDKKAAIEIGNDYGKSYELIVNETTVNGYEINDKGINTNTTLWANKNSMPKEKLNVVVDGVDVY